MAVNNGHALKAVNIYTRVAQNQDVYNVRYEALVSQYEATKAERDRVAAEIRQKGIRRREFERFIATLEKLPEEVNHLRGIHVEQPGRLHHGQRQG